MLGIFEKFIVVGRALYVESMGRTLLNLFKSYCTQLLKLDVVVATKNDLIGVEEVMLKSMFTQKVLCRIIFAVASLIPSYRNR